MDPAGVFATSFAKDQALVRTRPQAACLVLFVAALFMLPLVADLRVVAVMTSIFITSVVVVGLQINTGIAGQINLGQAAEVRVDSFPDLTFTATVIHMADQAEFTPRNVQTVEGRSATFYAIKLKVEDPDGKLKIGMPADVVFK